MALEGKTNLHNAEAQQDDTNRLDGAEYKIAQCIDDCIAAVALALYAVGVVPTGCKKLITYTVPLINFITGVGGNRVAGFAVGFSYMPLLPQYFSKP